MYEIHTKIKKTIENSLNSLEIDTARDNIDKYEQLAPFDMELLSYKIVLAFLEMDLEKAGSLLKIGINNYPMNGEMNYNMAYWYECQQNPFKAYEFYERARVIFQYEGEDEKIQELNIDENS